MLTAMARRYAYGGTCHCRNLEVRLESDKAPSELPLRTDTCSFCNKHRAVYTSDPEGQAYLIATDASRVERYRFGTKTADFVICKTCGVFVAAYMPEPALAVVNVNVLGEQTVFLQNELMVVNLDAETLEQRMARRRARWTPVGSFLVRPAAVTP
jgi:hypothetical protein